MGRRRWAVFGLVILSGAAVLPFAFRALLWRWESNPVLRGRLLARAQGCESCHRPFGGKEIENPGSRWGSVPAFQSGNSQMYVRERSEIQEVLRYGAPTSWLENPNTRKRLDTQRIRMPAYGDRLSDRELDDLTALVQAEEPFGLSNEPQASAGRDLARRLGCPSCHGPEGAGGLPNPGSLGGFIPGFLGKNFEDLVENREEFFEWVRTGRSRRLESNPLVRFFWRRQAVSMPAYDESLTESEIQSLWAWVLAARETLSSSPTKGSEP